MQDGPTQSFMADKPNSTMIDDENNIDDINDSDDDDGHVMKEVLKQIAAINCSVALRHFYRNPLPCFCWGSKKSLSSLSLQLMPLCKVSLL